MQDALRSSPPREGLGGGDTEDVAAAGSDFGTVRATFRGVPAYSNGAEPRYNSEPYGDYGIQYQCVEYVNRFSAQAMGLPNMKGTGHAISYQGAGRSGLTWVPNTPGPYLPDEGDILVFDASGYGHVAINMAPAGQSIIRTIQQNAGTPHDTLQVSGSPGQWVVSGGSNGALLGWQHVGELDGDTRFDGELSDGPVADGGGSDQTQAGDTTDATAADVAAPPAAAQQYTVQSGDTLWGIAVQLLGSGDRWPELYDQNRGVIGGNPDLILPGQVLQWHGTGSPQTGGERSQDTQDVSSDQTGSQESAVFSFDQAGCGLPLDCFLRTLSQFETERFDDGDSLEKRLTIIRKNTRYNSPMWQAMFPLDHLSTLGRGGDVLQQQLSVELPGGRLVDMEHMLASLDGANERSWIDGGFGGQQSTDITGWFGDLAQTLEAALNADWSVTDGASAFRSRVAQFASPEDMLANVDALVIARGLDDVCYAPGVSVTQILREYYQGDMGGRVDQRFTLFAEQLGLQPEGGGLAGRDRFVDAHTRRLSDLVGLFNVKDQLPDLFDRLVAVAPAHAFGAVTGSTATFGALVESLATAEEAANLPWLTSFLDDEASAWVLERFVDAIEQAVMAEG